MNPFSRTYIGDETDEQLIKNALAGDSDSLDKLLRTHQPFIYNVAWKMVQDPDDAADLTQEVLIKVATRLAKFNFKSAFRTWLYRIVVNHFLNDKKRACEKKVTGFDDMAIALDMIPNHEMTIEEQHTSKEVIREMNLSCVSGMLLCLTREQRIVFIIGELLGGDHNIGSEIMQISKANFRMKLQKARKDLYNFMKNKCGLVNKNNPCRCHKKVKVVFDQGILDAKKLLFNRKEYSTFQDYISEDADFLLHDFDKKYTEIHRHNTFKKDFDKKSFITEVIEDSNWQSKLNLS